MSGVRIVFWYFLLVFLTVACQENNPLPDPLEAGWQGKQICELMHEDNELRVLKCTFEPGVGHDRHYHKPHFGYTISGSRFQLKDEKGIRAVDLPSGYNFVSKGVEWHEVLNVGDSTAVFLIVEPK